MTEQGDPRERFILCVIDASFGRNAEEAKERQAGRKAIGIRSFPFFLADKSNTYHWSSEERERGRRSNYLPPTWKRVVVTNLQDWHANYQDLPHLLGHLARCITH